MAITQTNEYEIGVNNDLGNLANNVDNNRLGEDLTWLELDAGVIKVSVGSFIESQGNLYVVDTAAETPTGTAGAGAYLFFDDSIPGFVWSTTAGTYDPTRGGIYDVSNRRQCRWISIGNRDFRQLDIHEGLTYLRSPNFHHKVQYEVTQSGVGFADDYLSDNRVMVIEQTSSDLETWEFSNGAWSVVASSTVGLAGGAITRINSTRVLEYNTSTSYLAMWDESGGVWSQTGSDTTVSDPNDLEGACRLSGDNRVVIIDNSTGTESLEVWDFDGSGFVQVGAAYALPAGQFFGIINLAENVVAVLETANDYMEVYEYDGSTFSQIGSRLTLPSSINGISITNYERPKSFYNGTDLIVKAGTAGADAYLHINFDGVYLSIAQEITGLSPLSTIVLLSQKDNYPLVVSESNNIRSVRIGRGESFFRYSR